MFFHRTVVPPYDENKSRCTLNVHIRTQKTGYKVFIDFFSLELLLRNGWKKCDKENITWIFVHHPFDCVLLFLHANSTSAICWQENYNFRNQRKDESNRITGFCYMSGSSFKDLLLQRLMIFRKFLFINGNILCIKNRSQGWF